MTNPSIFKPLRGGFFLLCLLLGMGLAGCDSPGGTIREIRSNLDLFKKHPNMVTLELLDKSFAKIESQIKEMEDKGDTVQADLFRRQALTLRYEYRAVRQTFIKWSEEQLNKRASQRE